MFLFGLVVGGILGMCAGIWLHWWLTYDDKGPDE